MTPNPPRGVYSEVENIIEVVIKRKIVRSETELKVPHGGFRGGFCWRAATGNLFDAHR
jgi:hypothetical protein